MKVITIGRSTICDVVIHDASVGRIHLQIVLDNEGNIYAVDMNSTNGTYINEQKIRGKVRLHKNDTIRIGSTILSWQKYLSATASKRNRNKSVRFIAYFIVILILVCAGVYCMRIFSAPEPDPIETPQDYATGQPDDHPTAIEQNRNKSEKPSINTIPYDLIGHKLSEGIAEGYHTEDWTYIIEANSITKFSIDEILQDDNNCYSIVSSFHLKGGNNYYYDTRAKINYINDGSGWKLNYVNSLGMSVVSDGQYDDCIICDIADDGWGGVNCLSIRNISECSLIVGGQIRTNDGWRKFSCLVSPHDSGSVGGTFRGGNVQDYLIEFVVRKQ